VTDPQSPSSSGPPTPSHSSTHIPIGPPSISVPQPAQPSPLPYSSSHNPPIPPNYPYSHGYPSPPSLPQSPIISALASTITSSISLPGARLSGRLVSVVSLTDILNLYARASGLSPADPAESRSRRRRSSSSSLGVRKSGDIGREIGLREWITITASSLKED
jgi:hypothetical protein